MKFKKNAGGVLSLSIFLFMALFANVVSAGIGIESTTDTFALEMYKALDGGGILVLMLINTVMWILMWKQVGPVIGIIMIIFVNVVIGLLPGLLLKYAGISDVSSLTGITGLGNL